MDATDLIINPPRITITNKHLTTMNLRKSYRIGDKVYIKEKNGNKIYLTVKYAYFDYIRNSWAYVCENWGKPILDEHIMGKV